MAVLVPSLGRTRTSYPLSFPHAFLPGGVAGSWGGGQVDPAVLGVSRQTRQLRVLKAEACVWGLNGEADSTPWLWVMVQKDWESPSGRTAVWLWAGHLTSWSLLLPVGKHDMTRMD